MILPLLLVLLAAPARAQDTPADPDRVWPAAESWRLNTVDDARLPAQRGVTARLWGLHAAGLAPPGAALEAASGLYGSVSGGWGNTRVSAAAPLFLLAQGTAQPAGLHAQLGAPRVAARLLLVPGTPGRPGLGLTASAAWLPAATGRSAGGLVAGGLAADALALELGVVGDHDLGVALGSLNLGARLHPTREGLADDDLLFARAGVAAGPVPWLDGVLELHAALPLPALRTQDWGTTGAELLGGVRLGRPGGPELRALAGLGLSGGAAAQWRVGLGLAWARWGEPDGDRDGLAGAEDLCPDQPEDRDGFVDDDGCPDPDNDQDRVPDAQDACPDAAEDRDGTLDSDGCAEGEAVVQLRVELPGAWPAQPQVRFLHASTAPDRPPDTLISGRTALEVALAEGEWRLEVLAPGHIDRVEHLRVPAQGTLTHTVRLSPRPEPLRVELRVSAPGGAPLPAAAVHTGQRWTSADGVLGVDLPAGRVALRVEADGYLPADLELSGMPGATVQRAVTLEPAEPVRIQDGQLRLNTPLAFTPGLASLSGSSRTTLDALARVLLAHPELGVVRVEGHAAIGPDEATNLGLSQRMAEAVVQALVSRGVPAERLEAIGFGSTAELPLPSGQGVTLFTEPMPAP